MQVTVIGAGNMGRGIGHRLVAGGHDVTIVARDPEGAERLAEELAGSVPSGARVVKAFNTTFAGTLVDGQVAGQPLDVFIAGDDEEAKETVARLVRDGSLSAIDVGPLERARQLEGLGFLGIMLQQPLGLEFQSAWKLMS
jgi:8-hydroxy-5-deazaflavin:NADPH oxidoreductase